MKKVLFLKILLSTLFLTGQNKTELKGYVKNIKSDTLILAKSHEDLRYNGVEIPISEDKEFNFNLEHENIEEYSLVYKSDLQNGAWRPILFFPNGNKIEFELYPTNEFQNNTIIGDKLGEQKKKYQEQLGKKFKEKGNEIYGKIFQLEKDSEEFTKLKPRLDSLNRELLAFQYNYFLNQSDILSLNEYVNLLQDANQMMISPKLFKKYQEYYLQKLPNHPLTERANNLYIAISSLKVGQNYIDITFNDENNKLLRLSDLIMKEKITILDLWSPWCGPCIRKSKLLKENYSKISNEIQIVGVVGGVDEKLKAKKAINRFEYPWENYLEISNKNKIWEKYGIANSGGAQFLIDSEGKILSINPKLEEILKLTNKK